MEQRDLDEIAFGLRMAALSLREALLALEDCPALLRTFACDCAERV